MELYYGLLISEGKITADKSYDFLAKFVVDVTDDVIKEAMICRASNKAKNFSYVDCIGYITARTRNIKFLTGDKEFDGLEGVEFVK
ncbi:MAG: type II toxin-antitoxin system VapC family toxin [Candidatus Aenigmarchaeota archaeon]|nr:type II toxin-antitoxin system VapC family toxin [Candidatus Aenigmarchaeota archaeon]